MSRLTRIEFYDVLAGTDIKEAVIEALRIVHMDTCIVRFNFNGIEMNIYHFSKLEEEVKYYNGRLTQRGQK